MRGLSVVAALLTWLGLFGVSTTSLAAEPAGSAVSLSIGYLEALSNHDSIYIQGATAVFASDNMFLGMNAEGPVVWKSLYPVVVTKWMMHNRYDRYNIDNRMNTQGFLLAAGMGHGFDAWESTVRPFAGSVNALFSAELVARDKKEVAGSFPNGRTYLVKTNSWSGTVSAGFVVGIR